MNDKEIAIELAKNKADEIIVRKELDLAKKHLIDELNDGLGKELRENVINKPIKYKKPLKIKISEFLERLRKTLGD